MKFFVLSAAALTAATSIAMAQEPRRELGPHVHGHGTLNIAIEGHSLSMALDVPGMDIVGFEHAPNTPEQKATFEQRKAKLADAAKIFTPASAAGCKLINAKVEIEGGEKQPSANPSSTADKGGEEAQHTDFNAEYTFECKDLAKLTGLTFGYFAAFDGAQQLDVTIASPNGQNKYEVTRAKPVLELGGVM